MATDIFLEIDGIPGESQDKTYKDKIEIKDWSWSFEQPANPYSGGGLSAGKVTMNGIEFGKFMDTSTPLLAARCCAGDHLKFAKLYQRKAAGEGGAVEYLKIEMTQVLVSSISHTSSGEVPEEKLKLVFAQYKLGYAEQKEDGSLEAMKWHGFNFKENKKI